MRLINTAHSTTQDKKMTSKQKQTDSTLPNLNDKAEPANHLKNVRTASSLDASEANRELQALKQTHSKHQRKEPVWNAMEYLRDARRILRHCGQLVPATQDLSLSRALTILIDYQTQWCRTLNGRASRSTTQ